MIKNFNLYMESDASISCCFYVFISTLIAKFLSTNLIALIVLDDNLCYGRVESVNQVPILGTFDGNVSFIGREALQCNMLNTYAILAVLWPVHGPSMYFKTRSF